MAKPVILAVDDDPVPLSPVIQPMLSGGREALRGPPAHKGTQHRRRLHGGQVEPV
jgi:hypothetical protein